MRDRDPEPFDWYQRYSGIKEIITPLISQNSQILNVGSGNSSKVVVIERTERGDGR